MKRILVKRERVLETNLYTFSLPMGLETSQVGIDMALSTINAA